MADRIQQCDVLIDCALEEEADAVEEEFSHRCNVVFQTAFSTIDRYVYRYTTIQNRTNELLTILLISQARPGPLETGDHIKPLLQEFCPRFAAMTGICAGDKRKVKLGDLVVAEYAYHYEEGKVGIDRDGEMIHLPEWITHGTAKRVLQYVHNFKTWEEHVVEMKRLKMKHELKDAEWPKRFIAPMASGMAVRGDDPFPELQRHNRKTLALDQEAAAFYRTLHEFPSIYHLVVKGVCDYADPTKNDTYHKYAAQASAIYLLYFIQEYVTDETMPRRDMQPSQSRDGPSRVFKVPYRRNPFFTGREDLLQLLHDKLTVGKAAALTQPQAISGLGGIGKTQAAVEYAYRYQSDYRAILWARADSYGVLFSDFVSFAYLLNLPEKDERNQDLVVAAAKRWLRTNTSWLLILDNVEDLEMVSSFLAQVDGGHILLTTRAQAVGGFAQRIDLGKMALDVGALFLLWRAKIVAVGARLDDAYVDDQGKAREISQVMDGLPLALDQAGAYIEETGCGLSQYLNLYQARRAELLKQRGKFTSDHPDSVSTTFSLSFEKIKRANRHAVEMLQLCAFLDPDAIPEEIVADWAYRFHDFFRPIAKNQLELDKLVEELLKYSLVYRHRDEQTLSIHRLVQAVLKDNMKQRTRRMWEGNVVIIVNRVFPNVTRNSWSRCQRYLSHALICLELIEKWKIEFLFASSYEFSKAVALLEKAGDYLSQRARYKEAETMYQRLLVIEAKKEEVKGKSMDIVQLRIGEKLARVYTDQGKYSQAYDLFGEGWDLREGKKVQLLHSEYAAVETVASFNNVAKLFYAQGDYAGAAQWYDKAMTHLNKATLPKGPTTDCLRALMINNGGVLLALLDDERSEYMFQKALATQERVLGEVHPEVAGYLNNLASLYLLQGKYEQYEQAEQLFQRALAIRKLHFGKEHPEVGVSLNNLAALYSRQRKYIQAEPLFQQALTIQEQFLGPEHIDLIRILNNYADLLQKTGRLEEALKMDQRAEAILAENKQRNFDKNRHSLPTDAHYKPIWSYPGLYFGWCPPEIY